MNATASASDSIRIPCQACGASNAPNARFCGSCRGSLQGEAAPPPPPPHDNRFPFNGGSLFTGSTDNQTTVALPAAAAFEQAINALRGVGAEIQWASPSQGARFVAKHKEWGSTVRFHGTLTLTAAGPARTAIQVDLKTDWGSVVPLTLGSIAAVFVLGMMGNPLLLAYAMPIAVITVLYMGWWAGSAAPKKVAAKIFGRIGGNVSQEPSPSRWTGIFGRGGAANHANGRTPADSGSWPPPQANPQPDLARTTIVEQIRQLAAVRDEGLITPEEFAAKKAELLSRL